MVSRIDAFMEDAYYFDCVPHGPAIENMLPDESDAAPRKKPGLVSSSFGKIRQARNRLYEHRFVTGALALAPLLSSVEQDVSKVSLGIW
jgi:hypothetical protein